MVSKIKIILSFILLYFFKLFCSILYKALSNRNKDSEKSFKISISSLSIAFLILRINVVFPSIYSF